MNAVTGASCTFAKGTIAAKAANDNATMTPADLRCAAVVACTCSTSVVRSWLLNINVDDRLCQHYEKDADDPGLQRLGPGHGTRDDLVDFDEPEADERRACEPSPDA